MVPRGDYMRRGFGRVGPIGAQTSGNSRKAAVKRNIRYLIKAKDILTVHQRCISVIDDDVLAVCMMAVTRPSELLSVQNCIIWSVWQRLAESGKLTGIREGQNRDIQEFLWEHSSRLEPIPDIPVTHSGTWTDESPPYDDDA